MPKPLLYYFMIILHELNEVDAACLLLFSSDLTTSSPTQDVFSTCFTVPSLPVSLDNWSKISVRRRKNLLQRKGSPIVVKPIARVSNPYVHTNSFSYYQSWLVDNGSLAIRHGLIYISVCPYFKMPALSVRLRGH